MPTGKLYTTAAALLLAAAALVTRSAAAADSAPAVLPPAAALIIRRAEQIVVHIPFASERVRRHMHRANTHGERVLLYRIELADGTVGWGESMLDHAGSLAGLTGRSAAGLMADDRAGFGLQMAAIDAVGRACGVPAWQLLGNRRRERVPIAWWAIDMPPEDWAAEMAEAVRRGYRSCKLKARPWRDLAAQLDAVTAAVPAGFTTIIDFNGFLRDAAQAEAYLRLIDGLPIVGGYESPFYLQTDTAGAAALAEALKQPIFEHFHATVLHARAADGFLVAANYMPLGETRRQDTLCAAFSRPYWLQMVGTGITTAFMAHLGAVLEAATLPAVTCHELWEDDLLVERLEVKDGSLAVPDGPGLGVAVDTEAIARYRVADSKTPTPKDLYLARPRTIRIHIPPPGPVGTAAAAPGGDAAQVLEFPSEQAYYREFLEGRHPGFRPGTRLEVIEDTAAESHAPPG